MTVFPDVTVELLLGGVWTDVSSDVLERDAIQITRGRSDEGSRVEASRCSLTFRNTSGDYSPRNPTGAHFGLLGRNTPIRVSVEGGIRFRGEVSEWPASWDKAGADVTVQVQAMGVMRRLSQGDPLGSAMRRTVESESDVVAYWPMEDPEGSTSFASASSGASAMHPYAGTPDFAAFDGFATSLPLPTLANASLSAAVPTYEPAAAGSEAHQVLALVNLPAAGPTGSSDRLLGIEFTGGTISYALLDWRGAPTNDVTVQVVHNDDSFEEHAGVDVSGGGLFLVSALFRKTSPTNRPNIVLQIQEVGGEPNVFAGLSIFTTGDSFGRVTSIHVSPVPNPLTPADVSVGHVHLRNSTLDIADIPGVVDGHAGETAAARVLRLAGEEGIDFTLLGAAGDSAAMGPQPVAALLDIMHEAADTDLGILYEPRATPGLAYRTRADLYSQEPALTLDYAAGELSAIAPTDDDQQTKNDVTVKRDGGSSARAVDTDGPLGVDTVGRYSTDVTINPESDGQLPEQASWRLHLGTVDEARYPRLGVNLAAPAFRNDAVLSAAVTSLDLGDKIRVTNPPAWLPPDAIEQVVQGLTETIRPGEWTIEATCTPARPWDVGLWDDSTGAGESRYDTLGSELAVAIGTNDTSLSIATTAGPLWSDADQPFDIRIGGERITVTAVAGSTSPQTFTVTRSINGVVKSHAIGAAVSLFKPTYYAL